MDSECALFTLPFFPNPDSFIFHLFVGFHFTLKQYGGWARPFQLRCQYSTVQCVIQLHEIFQMWLRSLTNGGGSFPCNTDAIFIVFNNSFNSVMVLTFRDTYAYQEQPLVPRHRGFFTWNRHERLLLLLIFSQIRILFSAPTGFMALPRPGVFVVVSCSGTPAQGSTHRFQDPSNYSVVVVFWIFVACKIYTCPVIGAKCCKGWVIHPVLKNMNFFSFSDTRFVTRAIYIPSLFQPLPR